MKNIFECNQKEKCGKEVETIPIYSFFKFRLQVNKIFLGPSSRSSYPPVSGDICRNAISLSLDFLRRTSLFPSLWILWERELMSNCEVCRGLLLAATWPNGSMASTFHFNELLQVNRSSLLQVEQVQFLNS